MHLTFALITIISALVLSLLKDRTVPCTSANLVHFYNTPSHLSIHIYIIAYLQLYYNLNGLHTAYCNHRGCLN